MVQVLPYVPTFGQSLLPQISEAGGQITKALQKRSALAALEKYFPQNAVGGMAAQQAQGVPGSPASPMGGMPQQQPQINPLQMPQIYQLAVDAYGEDAAKQFVGSITQQQEHAQKQADQFAKEEREHAFKREEREVERKKEEQKQRKELVQKKQKIDRFNTDIEKLEKLKGATGSKLFADPMKYKFGPLDRKLTQDRADIDARGAGIADYLYNVALENKGALSEVKIKELVNPYKISSKDSERTYQGKLNYIKDVVKNMEQGISAEEALLNTPSTLKKLSREEAIQFYDKAGGDPKKAEELASQEGYIF